MSPARVIKHYCLIRADLPLGVMGAQLIHASRRSSQGVSFDDSTRAVALVVPSELQLLSIERKLIAKKIPHVAVREPDRDNELTAIGLAPSQETSAIKSILGNLPLLGKEMV